MTNITLEEAKKAIKAATEKAVEMDTKMDIAVVDRGGNLVAFERMDGAWIGSIDIAIDKAWTANAFDMSTNDLRGICQPVEDNICFGIHTTNKARVVIFGGGVPIKKGDEIIGAIGISGGYAETQDHPIAIAGAEAIS
jgi:uncharacterized protein GlcG (DUF336 family)